MYEWLARRELKRPVGEFLRSNRDFETVWGVAHRWCNREVPESPPEQIPMEVKEATYRLVRAYFGRELTLWMPDGHKVPNKSFGFLLKDRNPWRRVLRRCLIQGEFDFRFLSRLYLRRSEVITWCEFEKLPAPAFWLKATVKEAATKTLPLEGRARDEAIDKIVCQTIARTYWEIDPSIHPAHMIAAKAIRIFGNGGLYRDENTIKSWIVEVDPRKGERKTGRPEAILYAIDLKTGRLNDSPGMN